MNSFNFNNNNRNRLPTHNFFFECLQGNYNDFPWNNNNNNNNGFDDEYFNNNYNQGYSQNKNNNNNNNNNDSKSNPYGLRYGEFKRYQRLISEGCPKKVALAKAKYNPLLAKSAAKRKAESTSQVPSKRPNIVIQTKNTAKSKPSVSKDQHSSSSHKSTLKEPKRTETTTTTTSSQSKNATIRNNVNERSRSEVTKNKNNSSRKPEATSNENNVAKKKDNTIITATTNKHKSSNSTINSNKESISNKNISDSNTQNGKSTSNSNTSATVTKTTADIVIDLNVENNANNRICNSSNNRKTNNTVAAEKTTNENTISIEEEDNTSETAKDKSIGIGIMAKGFPDVVLDENELEQLEEAIVQAMSEGWTSKLIFDGIIYRPGVLLIECSNHKTANWLTLIIKNLPNWRGPDLEARFGYNMPDVKFITIYLPKSAHRDDQFLLKLLAAQNERLYIKLWKVFCSIAQGQGKLMTIGVDELSFESITQCDFLLRYRFGKIMVHTQTPGNIMSDPLANESANSHATVTEDFELDEEDLNGIEECFNNIKNEKPD